MYANPCQPEICLRLDLIVYTFACIEIVRLTVNMYSVVVIRHSDIVKL